MDIFIVVTSLVTRLLIAESREKIKVWKYKEIEYMWTRYLVERCGEEIYITKIPNISEVAKYDSGVDKNDIHYDEKQDEYVNE